MAARDSIKTTPKEITKNISVKSTILLIAIVITIPLVVNIILQVESFSWFPAHDGDWLSFFGSYFGAFMGITCSLYILYKTQRQNYELHLSQRKYQMLLTRYMQESSNYQYLEKHISELNLFIDSHNIYIDIKNTELGKENEETYNKLSALSLFIEPYCQKGSSKNETENELYQSFDEFSKLIKKDIILVEWITNLFGKNFEKFDSDDFNVINPFFEKYKIDISTIKSKQDFSNAIEKINIRRLAGKEITTAKKNLRNTMYSLLIEKKVETDKLLELLSALDQ